MVISETVKEGKITHLSGQNALVAISCEDDSCHGCRLSSMCGGSKDNIEIKAHVDVSERLSTGDRVIIVGRLKGWLTSWFLLAGIPCIAILGALIGGFALGLRDDVVGSSALGVAIAYYIVLWLMRDRLERRVEWIVESKKEDCNLNGDTK